MVEVPTQQRPVTMVPETLCERGSKRMRRIGIPGSSPGQAVALARKLLVALWRYLEKGEVPSGAILATR